MTVHRPLEELFAAVFRGKFLFTDFLEISVPDNVERVDWNSREIVKPSKTLKAFHGFLNSYLFQKLPENPRVSFAYRKGTNPHQAVVPHRGARALFQTDISKFFHTIQVPLIRRSISGPDVPILDLPKYLDRIVELTTVDGRLPIGFSTSPLISNACLRSFDDEFEAVCLANAWTYSRYADDILVSAASKRMLDGVAGAVTEVLARTAGSEFKLHPDKSKVTTVGRKLSALGMVILPSSQVAIDGKLKKKIEAQIHFYISDPPKLASMLGKDPEAAFQALCGFISHVNAADQAFLEKLRRKFGVTVIDSLLHRTAI